MAILRQQSAFVDELYASGIVNDSERQVMQACASGMETRPARPWPSAQPHMLVRMVPINTDTAHAAAASLLRRSRCSGAGASWRSRARCGEPRRVSGMAAAPWCGCRMQAGTSLQLLPAVWSSAEFRRAHLAPPHHLQCERCCAACPSCTTCPTPCLTGCWSGASCWVSPYELGVGS